MTARKLNVVPAPASPEAMLRDAIRGRDEAMATVREFDRIIGEQGRRLAKKRGLAFIRVERLKQEFGG